METLHWTNVLFLYTAGKISIEHVTIFPQFFSKGTVDLTFSPDVSNNPSNSYIQIISEIKLRVIK